jgi:hypothetical protein
MGLPLCLLIFSLFGLVLEEFLNCDLLEPETFEAGEACVVAGVGTAGGIEAEDAISATCRGMSRSSVVLSHTHTEATGGSCEARRPRSC